MMMAGSVTGTDTHGAVEQIASPIKLPKADRRQRNYIERLEVEWRLVQDAHEGLFRLLDTSRPEQPSGFLCGVGHPSIPAG
jgi:hypothetical protein